MPLNGWDPYQDLFEGLEQYGDPMDESLAWAIKFDDLESSLIKVESFDSFSSYQYSYDELLTKMNDGTL